MPDDSTAGQRRAAEATPAGQAAGSRLASGTDMAADADAPALGITVRGHDLQAVSVVRDWPLDWNNGGYYETGFWMPGDLVTARVTSDQPPSIVVFARFASDRRSRSDGWTDVWTGTEADYGVWNGNWTIPAARYAPGVPLARWLADVTVPGGHADWPPGAPSTADFTAWAAYEDDGGQLVTLTLGEDGALVDESGSVPALISPVEAAPLNAALARAVRPGMVPLRWDQARSVLLCPPDRHPDPAERDLSVRLRRAPLRGFRKDQSRGGQVIVSRENLELLQEDEPSASAKFT